MWKGEWAECCFVGLYDGCGMVGVRNKADADQELVRDARTDSAGEQSGGQALR